MTELVVLKLGGSVITRKDEELKEVDAETLERISREIRDVLDERKFNLVVVHGAGPFGHIPAKKYGLHKGLRGKRHVQGFIETHKSMEDLNYKVVEALKNAGLNAMAFQPSSSGILRDGRLVSFSVDAVRRLVSLGVVPVGYGDVLVDEKTGFNILSGDHLVSYLAGKLKADRVIMAADVKGIYTADPKVDEKAELIVEINSNNIHKLDISGSTYTDVTGGMKRKVEELLSVAKSGVNIRIVSGLEKGMVKKALSGQHVGTVIKK